VSTRILPSRVGVGFGVRLCPAGPAACPLFGAGAVGWCLQGALVLVRDFASLLPLTFETSLPVFCFLLASLSLLFPRFPLPVFLFLWSLGADFLPLVRVLSVLGLAAVVRCS
jgi:hypothetical protein